MKVQYFDWDEVNEDHIARHGVDTDEVEEVFIRRHRLYRSREGRYVVLGQSMGGRYLMIVLEQKEHGEIRVVTARDMSEKERRRFKREVS